MRKCVQNTKCVKRCKFSITCPCLLLATMFHYRDGGCGPGVACGVIARSAGIGENYKKICACDGVTLWDERNKPLAGQGRRS